MDKNLTHMKQYHVYQTSLNGEYIAVDTTGCNSVQEVEKKLPPNVNWYGLDANSAEEAVEKVKAIYEGSDKSLFREASHMTCLQTKANTMSLVTNYFLMSGWERKNGRRI